MSGLATLFLRRTCSSHLTCPRRRGQVNQETKMKKLLALLLLPLAVSAETLVGPVEVIDGDSITMFEVETGKFLRLNLWGIDAPELSQICGKTPEGKYHPCGKHAAQKLRDHIGIPWQGYENWESTILSNQKKGYSNYEVAKNKKGWLQCRVVVPEKPNEVFCMNDQEIELGVAMLADGLAVIPDTLYGRIGKKKLMKLNEHFSFFMAKQLNKL